LFAPTRYNLFGNYSIYFTQASVIFLFIITRLFCMGDWPVAPTSIFRHRMLRKHPRSFSRASAVYPKQISPNKGFPRHRMSGRHPMSNHNEFHLGNKVGFAIIMSCRGE